MFVRGKIPIIETDHPLATIMMTAFQGTIHPTGTSDGDTSLTHYWLNIKNTN
jgi:hypothetical protein